MIEITHKQAQRMIREQQDRQLPDEQWANLQAHLENCAACRRYQEQLIRNDHDLRRALQMRWGGVHGPKARVEKGVLARIERRKRLRRGMVKALPYVAGVVLLALYIAYRQVTAPPPALLAPPPTPTLLFGFAPAVTATPAQPKLDFRGVTVFETHRDSNAEIYMLNVSPNGPELTNLTQNPAQDTAPAWSPDGEWIAFLSDRSGRNEVYVMHVAGSRLTQLTDQPGVQWQAPLEWSADGKYIALRGRRATPDNRAAWSSRGSAGEFWMYLVPLDGSAPRSLDNSYGVETPAHFSMEQFALAFASARPLERLVIGNTLSGWTGTVTQEDSQSYDLSGLASGAFAWSLGGHNLVYVANSLPGAEPPARSELRLSQDLESGDHLSFTGSNATTIDSVSAPERFWAVSWMPHSLMVAALAGQADCRVVRLKNAYSPSAPAREIPGLCVVGGLGANNWTDDGNWLVLLGRLPRQAQVGLYALKLPDTGARNEGLVNPTTTAPAPFEKLLDLQDIVDAYGAQLPGFPTWAEPQVRPSGRLLDIQPKPASSATAAILNIAPITPANPQSWVVYSVNDGLNSQIVRVHPDGTQRLNLTGSPLEHTCPRLGPDGKTIAYLSAEEGMKPGVNEVYRMDIDGGNVTRLTNGFTTGSVIGRTAPFPRYDCPVWSPDGKWLAAVLRLEFSNYLALIPADGKSAPVYLKSASLSSYSPPVWLPKELDNPAAGAGALLLVYPGGVRPARIGSLNLDALLKPSTAPTNSADAALAVPVDEEVPLAGWHDMEGLTLSPDGSMLAGIAEYLGNLRDANNTGVSIAELRVYDTHTFAQIAAQRLLNFDASFAGRQSLFWLPDQQIGVARLTALSGPTKTIFSRLYPQKNFFEDLLPFEDALNRPVLIQGSQVLFASESGLWTANFPSSGPSVSLRKLTGESVKDLDWR